MAKRLTILAALAVLLVAGTVDVSAQAFRGSITQGACGADGSPVCADVYIRNYIPNNGNQAGIGAAPNCAGREAPDEGVNQKFCLAEYRAGKASFDGYIDDLATYGAAAGTVAYTTYALQRNGGSASHAGYYGWTNGAVNSGDVNRVFNPNCPDTAGQANSCTGKVTSTYATGSDQTGIPGPDLGPDAYMRPIPVPKVTSVSPQTAPTTINLSWDAVSASGVNADAAQGYRILAVTGTPSAGNCPAPTDADFLGGGAVEFTSATNSAAIATSALGAGADDCVTFALRIEYDSAAGAPILSRFVSANSQAVYLGSGGLAATIVGVEAEVLGVSRAGLAVNVTWDTDAEQNLEGFYVARATSADGEYVRVSPLIPANNEPTKDYQWLDRVQRPRDLQGVQGLFYRIEAVDADKTVSIGGPVLVTLPDPTADPRVKRPGRGR